MESGDEGSSVAFTSDCPLAGLELVCLASDGRSLSLLSFEMPVDWSRPRVRLSLRLCLSASRSHDESLGT